MIDDLDDDIEVKVPIALPEGVLGEDARSGPIIAVTRDEARAILSVSAKFRSAEPPCEPPNDRIIRDIGDQVEVAVDNDGTDTRVHIKRPTRGRWSAVLIRSGEPRTRCKEQIGMTPQVISNRSSSEAKPR